MHEPRPYGLHVDGGGKLTANDIVFIDNAAKRLTNYKALSGVDSLKQVHDLPDGGTVIIQDIGGVFRAVADKRPAGDEKAEEKAGKPLKIPMLFSGIITTAPTVSTGKTGVRFTEQCRIRLNNYYSNNEGKPLPITESEAELTRFTISSGTPGWYEFTSQYSESFPSRLTGSMAEVAQIVAGYGRQDLDNLPDTPLERAVMTIPPDVAQKIDVELSAQDSISALINNLTNFTGKILFNHRYAETHAIVFSSDNKPWLVSIERNTGVYAMPLPMIPATTTRAFYNYIKSKGDHEILAILDKYGGMPSGAGFQQNWYYYDEAEILIKAGVLIYVCSMSDFYKNLGYSEHIGWALNSRGSEGYNTCYSYNGAYYQSPVYLGYTYRLNFDFKPIDVVTRENTTAVDNYLAKLAPIFKRGTLAAQAIQIKVDRAQLSILQSRAGMSEFNINVEYAYWDSYRATPVAPHAGFLTLIEQGNVYTVMPKYSTPQFKVPSGNAADFVATFDLINSEANNTYPDVICDTTMFVYYLNDQPKFVKYYSNPKYTRETTEGTGDRFDLPNEWAIGTYQIGGGHPGGFYSKDLDIRKSVEPAYSEKRFTYDVLGPEKKPRYSFWMIDTIDTLAYQTIPNWPRYHASGEFYRYWFYKELLTITNSNGQIHDVTAAIPVFNRNAVAYAFRQKSDNKTVEQSTLGYAMGDPIYYIFGGISHTGMGPLDIQEVTVLIPKYDNNRHTFAHTLPDGRQGGQRGSLWIPSKPWLDISQAQGLIHSLTPQVQRPLNASGINENIAYGGPSFGGEQPEIPRNYSYKVYDSGFTGKLYFSGAEKAGEGIKLIHESVPINKHFNRLDGYYPSAMSCYSTKNCFGTTYYVNYGENETGGAYAAYGTCSLVTDHTKPIFFIGVINE